MTLFLFLVPVEVLMKRMKKVRVLSSKKMLRKVLTVPKQVTARVL